jgi:hypothetical protein
VPRERSGRRSHPQPTRSVADLLASFVAEASTQDSTATLIQWLSNDSLIMGTGADKVFNRTFRIISKLYESIDSKGDAEAAAARRMSVEFIQGMKRTMDRN